MDDEYVTKMLCDRYGNDIGESLAKWLIEAINEHGDECTDNVRVRIVSDWKETKEYKKAKANGCCGFHDFKVVHDSVEYEIGFNYGH